MTEHVLCAVDLTHQNDSRNIIAKAHDLAAFYDATLSVITVLPDYGSSWVGSFFKEGTMHEAAEAASESLHALVNEAVPGHDKIQHIVEVGTVYERVLAMIEKISADLVVVGAHKPDFADRMFGPNSARIVRYSPVSVLVVKF